MLNKRQRYIINILCDKNEYITGKQLSSILQVTDRTIRHDIVMINQEYNVPVIRSSKRWGYKYDSSNSSLLENLNKTNIPQNSKERCIYIIKELLFNRSQISILALQDQVFVSNYSIDNDIKKIKSLIEGYPSLQLVRSKNHIALRGTETDKRTLYETLLKQETQGNFTNLNIIAKLWSDFDLLAIKDIFEAICDCNDYPLKQDYFPTIMIHIGVSVERIINGSYVQNQKHYTEVLGTIDYQVVRSLFVEISNTLGIPYVEDEVLALSILLHGKRTGIYNKNLDLHEIILNTDELVDILLQLINNSFNVDFTKDYDFIIGFSMHLKSMIDRCISGVSITNCHLNEIKRSYPLIFEMAIHIGKKIQELCAINVNENELAYIALHLGVAYDRVNIVKKFKVLLVSPNNHTLSKLCNNKLLLRFGERINIIGNYEYFEESIALQSMPELIISTTQLNHNLPILTVHITMFVNYEDEGKVFNALNILERRRYHYDFANMVKELIKPELFHTIKRSNSPNDIISFMCDDLIKRSYATLEYKQDVLKRESMSATSFVSGFAIPHAIEVKANISCISVVIMKEPLKWGNYDVSLIILLSINEENQDLLRIFFDWLNGIVTDSNSFSNLLQIKSFSEFIQFVTD